MSLRPRRALLGLIAAAAAFAALPASALAAGETLSVTPSNTQAGSNPSIKTAITFADSGDTPKTVVVSLAPGLLANGTANPSCTQTTQLSAACQVGTADVTVSAPVGTLSNNPVYIVPPQHANEFAGFETVLPAPFPPGYTGASLRTTPTVGVDLTTTFQNTNQGPTPVTIDAFSLTLNPTLNGVPFTHLPTSCSTATTTSSITYYGATPAASPSGSFTPTGCTLLPYAPKLSAAITKDKNDSGAAITLTQTQALGEASSKTIVFSLPKGLTPNVAAAGPCLTGTPCQIGTAKATAPGVPDAALANGTVTLTGSISAPKILVSFPAPFGLTDTGDVGLANGTVTFADVPDLPLTSLALSITGPNGQKAFNTDCAPASIGGQFTAQSGATASVTAPIAFTGCASKPTASGSTSGLASGHPSLKFKVTHGKGAAKVASVALGVPSGLKFSKSAIVKHKTCATKKGKKKCTTTTLIKGLKVVGGKAKTVAIKGGKLVITLKSASNAVTITTSGPLVSESKSLQTKVKNHKVKTLNFSVKVTDAKKTSTTVPLKFKAH